MRLRPVLSSAIAVSLLFLPQLSSGEEQSTALVNRVRNVLNSDEAGRCDKEWGEKKLEIADVLDRKSDEIAKFSSAKVPSEVAKISLSPIFLRDPQIKKNSSEWVRQTNWDIDRLARDFNKIRETSVDEKWLELNLGFRQHLQYDEWRAIGSFRFFFDRHNIKMLEPLSIALSRCDQDHQCLLPQLSKELNDFCKGIRTYRDLNQSIRRATDAAGKRRAIAEFTREVNSDLGYYVFKHNPGIIREGRNLIVPLDPGPFDDAKTTLARWIEDFWRSHDLQVKVKWVSAPKGSKFFRFVLGKQGAVPETHFSESDEEPNFYISVVPDQYKRILLHEMGHVLGLADAYYLSWDPISCRYSIEMNSGEIMSNSQGGLPTDEDWALLNNAYPSTR